jgi:serine/threonine-protein kinase
VSFDSIDDARFVSGALLAERYRIVGLLGRGGMGEVYRADDLKLGQPVALKFVSDRLAGDPESLSRLYREVRVARQVSHPNVCRVYDIGEFNGQHFLSMEFVKGEELSSLLHRIGRLPADKATEIARQICAGLAAAHNRGVLHRDLKPSNVMIDEHGNARLTDFGIAALTEEIRDNEIHAGTPAYMSPEQLEGKELTTKSDIYSLGLVLYELFTGQRAFDAPSLPQLLSLRRSNGTPTKPSSLIQNLDPLIEHVILRCLEKDADRRPASALQVASALPGGDPLAAALAMGETPSPEAVAGAPTEGLLKPAVAITCLGVVVLLLVLVVLLSRNTNLLNVIPAEKSPEVLAERAREINRRFGYISRPADTAQGFDWNRQMVNNINRDTSPARWEVLKSGDARVFFLWYLQSPRYLVGQDRLSVAPGNPPFSISGMSHTQVDLQGRLIFFRAVPPQLEDPSTAQAAPDWSVFFTEAGFERSQFQETDSRWIPPEPSDARAAWDGILPGNLKIPIHIEAAAFRGKPVYFNIIYSWDRPLRQEEPQPQLALTVKMWLVFGLIVATVIAATLIGFRNVRLGLGDQHGAFRLALYTFIVSVVHGMLVAHHVPTNAESGIVQEHLAWALLLTITIWIVYLALEPFVRGRWPHSIISWKRFISGQVRDPLVGRDLLVGILLGVIAAVILASRALLPRLWGSPEPVVPATRFVANAVAGVREQIIQMLQGLQLAPFVTLTALFVILILTIILRKRWLVVIAAWLLAILAGPFLPGDVQSQTIMSIFMSGLFAAIFMFALLRFGLLTATVAFFSWFILFTMPLTSNLSAWFASATILIAVVLLGVAFFGFYHSMERRSAVFDTL